MVFSCFRKSVDISPSSSESERERFFVITAIFNPCGFAKRYELYHSFANHITQECGLQLVTVECIFPSLNQTEFQVTKPTNPLHIQIKAPSIYWMKENLINIAVSRLPPQAKWIAWLDADIKFDSLNWADLTISALKKKYLIVQVFKKGKFLGPNGETLRTDYSFGYSAVHGKIIDQKRYDEWYPHPGYGWASTVDTFRLIKGLPEYDIVGSGDLHFAFTLLNRVSNAVEDQLHPEFKQLVLRHCSQTFEKLQNRRAEKGGGFEILGYIPVNISHNWHGSRKDRQYVGRWKILIAHQFNFNTDMVRTKEGVMKFIPEREPLQQDIIKHFQIRNEDGDQFHEGEDLKQVPKLKKKETKPTKTLVKTKLRRSSSSSSSSDDEFRRRMRRQQEQDILFTTLPVTTPPPGDEWCPIPGIPPCPPEDGTTPICPPSPPPDADDGNNPPPPEPSYPGGDYYQGITSSMQY